MIRGRRQTEGRRGPLLRHALAAGVAGLLTAIGAPSGVAGQVAAAPGKRLLALDDLYRMRDVDDPRLSPDGAWVAYTVTVRDSARDEDRTAVYLVSWDGRTTRRLTWGTEGERAPRWSPDGKSLAFLSSRGDAHRAEQVWILPRDGGEATRVTALADGVSEYAWAPDGRRLAVIARDADPAADERDSGRRDTATAPPPIVITRFQFRADNIGWLTERRTRLYVVDVPTGQATLLTPGPVDAALPAWSPDGRQIAYVRKTGEDGDRTFNNDVYAIDAQAGATPRQVTTFPGDDNDPDWESGPPAWSGDGRSIAYVQGGPPELFYYGMQHLAVTSAEGGGPERSVLNPADRIITFPRWTHDGRSLLFLIEDDRAVQLARVSASGGAMERLVAGRQVISGYDLGSDGRIAFASSTPTAPAEIFALEPGARTPRPLTHENAWLDSVSLATVREVAVRSADGTDVHGFAVTPPGYTARTRYPTILRNHGGPVWEWGDEFYFDWQLFAAHGYVVLGANPRGSSGRGQEYARAIYADWGNKDVANVLALVDTAVAQGLADSARLGVGGWSYGAILTDAVIARTQRFKAATSGAGQGNALAGYGTDEYVREYETELGLPWAHPDVWQRVAYPFFHADRIVTPTLFLCGDLDANVPLLNSEQMYQALRSLRVDAELIVYPGEYHDIARPSHVRDRLERYLAWYDRYLHVAPEGRPGAR